MTYTYDANGQLKTRLYPDGSRTTWTYDALGNPLNIEDALGDHLRTYDANEQTRSYTNPDGRTLTFIWDAIGQRHTMTDPDGGVTSYTYDAVGRLTKLIDPQDGITTFQYDSLGREVQKQLANETITTTTYDANNWLRKVVNATSTGTTITAFEYQYDALGNKISQTNSDNEITTWTYDLISQLLSENMSDEITTWTYDPTGNRLTQETISEITTSVYDVANQLQWSENNTGITTYAYDNNGNQISVESPVNEVTTNTWTYENQLRSVENPLGEITTYTYSPVNRTADEYQVIRETEEGITNYIWDNNNILQEYDTTTEAQYNYQPETYGNLISQHRESESSYYHYDGNFSTSALTDNTQTETDYYKYTAWGETLTNTGSTENPFIWKGEVGYVFDEATALYTLRRRQYTPQIGRFISEDPIGILSNNTNFYTYTENNAPNWIDPSGFVICKCSKLIYSSSCSGGYAKSYPHTYTYKKTKHDCEKQSYKLTSIGVGGSSGNIFKCEEYNGPFVKLIGLCKNDPNPEKCENEIINILYAAEHADYQTSGVYGFIERTRALSFLSTYGGACHYWTAEFTKKHNTLTDRKDESISVTAYTISLPENPESFSKWIDHAFVLLRNQTTGKCLIIDDRFWGNFGYAYSPCEVSPNLSEKGKTVWDYIKSRCDCKNDKEPEQKQEECNEM